MSSPLDFSGHVVLITGGSRGIGRGIAETFLAAGADVAVCGRNEPDELANADGKSAIFVAADVRDAEQVEKMVNEVVERLGRLDVLVNNAGGAPFAEAATVSPSFSEKIIQLNLTAALHCAQQANRVMQGQDSGGSIINIASVSGVRPSPGTAAYGAAKAGLINLSGTLAIEWGPKVRVNVISASMILTEQAHLHYGDDEGIARVAETVPLKRLGTPDDIAGACLYFASPLASYVSGANLLLHGGGETPAFLSAATVNRGE
ncbi:MAG: SDR family oxidoreductase [Deltaproteobacteria bacterium]|nr:SDR family oxidoreductase [Deltaproteobacteria bacterium]MBW1874414.1 SDR family oxidoreductase [Deltaproteobacteria bacterium]MBW2209605.1 SDR family oxidoreductase [Deltaproteobacteria bacterium]MBW2213259.1 SDR family oxidoreductase [Deltaproteobacteria bacterium]MBW2378326.1 SDR family oxidoreductase [Deltaproteobacteria bacterium]